MMNTKARSLNGKRVALGLMAILLIGSPACGQDKTLGDLQSRFQAVLDSLQLQNGFPGATASFILPDGQVFACATGYADVEHKVQMTPESMMLSGSIGKSFVAAIILQMASEGKLSLNDTAIRWFGDDTWFAELPNGRDITVWSLLNHSRGWGDWLDIQGMYEGFLTTLSSDSAYPFTHEQRLQALVGTDPLFATGDGYA